MAQWILKDTMKIVAPHTIRPLTKDEHRDLNLIKEREREKKLNGKVLIVSRKQDEA